MHEDLLVPLFRGGKLVCPASTLEEIRERLQTDLAGFHDGVKRFVNPHQYPAGLEQSLYELKTKLVLEARGFGD